MAAAMALLLLMSAGARAAGGGGGGGGCVDSKDLSAQLTVESRRNTTGHWETKVEMAHSDAADPKQEPWKMDVRQVSTDCNSGGPGFVFVSATLVSPRAASVIPEGKQYAFERPVVADGSRYALSVTKAKWVEARAVCRRRGGDLLVIGDSDEAVAVKVVVSSLHDWEYVNGVAHAGFHDLDHEGHYVTVQGKPLETGYAQWAPGNPGAWNGRWKMDIEDCGGVDNNALLHDVPCEDELRFVCEEPYTATS